MRERRERILFDVKGSKNVPQDFTGAPPCSRARARVHARAREYVHVLWVNQRSRPFALRAQNTFDLALPYY